MGLARNRAAAQEPTVMLVDDHPLSRDTLRKVIERQGAGQVVAEADRTSIGQGTYDPLTQRNVP